MGRRYDIEDDNTKSTIARTGELTILYGWDDRFDDAADGKQGVEGGKVSYFIPVKRGGKVLAMLATGSTTQEEERILRQLEVMQPLLDLVVIALDHVGALQEQRMSTSMERLQRAVLQMTESNDATHLVRVLDEELRDQGFTQMALSTARFNEAERQVNFVQLGPGDNAQVMSSSLDHSVSAESFKHWQEQRVWEACTKRAMGRVVRAL